MGCSRSKKEGVLNTDSFLREGASSKGKLKESWNDIKSAFGRRLIKYAKLEFFFFQSKLTCFHATLNQQLRFIEIESGKFGETDAFMQICWNMICN